MPDAAYLSAVPPGPIWLRLHLRRKKVPQLVVVASEADVQATLEALGARLVSWERPRVHQCRGCGKHEPWSPTWSWYGSYKQFDDGEEIVKACSDACMMMLQGLGIVPPGARTIDDA